MEGGGEQEGRREVGNRKDGGRWGMGRIEGGGEQEGWREGGTGRMEGGGRWRKVGDGGRWGLGVHCTGCGV